MFSDESDPSSSKRAKRVRSDDEAINRDGFESISKSDQMIVRALVSISAADARQTLSVAAPPPRHLVFLTVDQLMADAQFAICHPATLKNLQALVAVQLFLVSLLKFNLAARLGGIIARMAFHLGLHRCPARFRHFNASEAELRRRMFFCVYCLDRILCQFLGLPLGINDTDVDVCYPGEETHAVDVHAMESSTAECECIIRGGA